MTLSLPTRLNPLRRISSANLTDRSPAGRLKVPGRTVIPSASNEPARSQHILMVRFRSPDGRSWHAVGGGDTLVEAIAYAQESLPTDVTWRPISWSDLYGD
jgi:hypothetical protein